MKHSAPETRKITVHLPAKLLDDLLRDSGKGITETLRDLLEQEKRRRAWAAFAELRGKVKFDMTWEEMKEDRE